MLFPSVDGRGNKDSSKAVYVVGSPGLVLGPRSIYEPTKCLSVTLRVGQVLYSPSNLSFLRGKATQLAE